MKKLLTPLIKHLGPILTLLNFLYFSLPFLLRHPINIHQLKLILSFFFLFFFWQGTAKTEIEVFFGTFKIENLYPLGKFILDWNERLQ